MGILSPIFLKHFLLLVIAVNALLYSVVIAQEDTPKLGYSMKERISLYAFKSTLENPFLNNAWSGPHCDYNLSKWYGIRCDSEGLVIEIVLESLGLRGKINANSFTAFTKLYVLSLKNNSLGGTEIDFSFNQRLTRVDLSKNEFSGKIPVSLVEIPDLESIFLRDNLLTGQIPEFDQSSLKEFDVSNNNLSGLVPKTRALQSLSYTSFIGNPNLCGPPSTKMCEPIIRTGNDISSSSSSSSSSSPSSSIEDNKNSTKKSFLDSLKWYLLPFEFVILVILILLFILYFKHSSDLKKKIKQYHANQREMIPKQEEYRDRDHQTMPKTTELEVREQRSHQRSSCSRSKNNNASNSFDVSVQERAGKLIFLRHNQGFEKSDLLTASAEGLGQGTFGNCYKAVMEGKPVVVVRRLKNLKPLTVEEFEKQLFLTIAVPNHPNLLPLLAYCNSKDEKLLVHSYVQNGNLFNRLQGGRVKMGSKDSKSERIPFKWGSRLHVARDVARAMSHLHQTSTASLLPHGNLKSTNVLLLGPTAAVVSDYGLSSVASLPVAAQRSAAYRSPEYLSSKRVSPKSDVWTYGCLLLELLTGRVSAHAAPPGARGEDLGAWVHRAVREEWTAEVFDREILGMGRGAVPAMLRLLEIALMCVERSPERRPAMSDVARMVEDVCRCSAADVSESEDGDDGSSLDRSLTDDDSSSTVASGNNSATSGRGRK